MGEEPVSVVYVAGSGRTGSTLLSLLLTQARGTANLGQIRDLAKAVAAGAVCTCGAPVADCPFWAPVARAAGFSDDGASERVNALRKDFVASDPWRVLRQPGARAEVAAHPYAVLLSSLYAAAAAAAPGCVLVDTSKTPEIALALSLDPRLSVTVVHLLRDPRAVACSWERKLSDRRRTIGFCRRWRQRVRVLDAWAAAGGTPVVPLRYEDFARRPRAALARLAEATPLTVAEDLFEDDVTARISWQHQHLFPPANESVLARRETRVAIRPSTAWRAPGNLPLHVTALRHTSPEGLRYCLPAWLPGARARDGGRGRT